MPNLGECCLLSAANDALDTQVVIDALDAAGKDFCSHVPRTVISSSSWEQIHNAKDGAEALGIIRLVLLIALLQIDKKILGVFI